MREPTILVAEDDPAMRRWLVTVLCSQGNRTLALADGWELWTVVMEEDVDLVVSDMRMPVTSGIEALTLLRITGVQVPFLLITAFAGDDVRLAASELGAEVLAKPFGSAVLRAHVRRMIDAH
jgi:DNA-binding response OmpR family regulator